MIRCFDSRYGRCVLRRLAGRASLFLLAGSLSGCLASFTPQAEPARYDLFATTGAKPEMASGLPALRLIEIQAPSWLQAYAMQYRLSYQEPGQRLHYAHSRWAAAPAELLEQVLRRSALIERNRYEQGACSLHLELQEFIQDFSTPAESQAIIQIRASLQTAQGDLLAREDFKQQHEAGADARQGVVAFQAASQDLNHALAAWLQAVQSRKPDAMAGCGGG